MAAISTSDFRNGKRVLINNEPHVIVENEFVKPGKGQAFTRIKLRNLRTKRMVEKTCKSGESLVLADVVEEKMQYLYNDGDLWFFMNAETYEQIAANREQMQGVMQWISENDECNIVLWDGAILTVEAPDFVNLKVLSTDPGVKGDTVSGGSKPATLAGGAVIQVPLFISPGEVLKVDTRKAAYVGRVKE